VEQTTLTKDATIAAQATHGATITPASGTLLQESVSKKHICIELLD